MPAAFWVLASPQSQTQDLIERLPVVERLHHDLILHQSQVLHVCSPESSVAWDLENGGPAPAHEPWNCWPPGLDRKHCSSDEESDSGKCISSSFQRGKNWALACSLVAWGRHEEALRTETCCCLSRWQVVTVWFCKHSDSPLWSNYKKQPIPGGYHNDSWNVCKETVNILQL